MDPKPEMEIVLRLPPGISPDALSNIDTCVSYAGIMADKGRFRLTITPQPIGVLTMGDLRAALNEVGAR